MNGSRFVLSALLLTVPCAFAQEPARDGARPAGAREAAAPQGAPLTFHLAGVQEDTAAKLQEALAAIAHDVFVCPDCSAEKREAGECEACETELTAERRPTLAKIQLDAKTGSAVLTPARGAVLRLNDLDRALRAGKASIDREKLPLAGAALVYTGAHSQDDAVALQKAFREAGHADAVATFDAESSEVHLTTRSGKLSWSQGTDVGAKLSAPLRLVDAVWAPRQRGRAS